MKNFAASVTRGLGGSWLVYISAEDAKGFYQSRTIGYTTRAAARRGLESVQCAARNGGAADLFLLLSH